MEFKNYKFSEEPLKKRVVELEEENKVLADSIADLNECYQTKISLMQEVITEYESKNEELLEWKAAHIDQAMEQTDKYQAEFDRIMVAIGDMENQFKLEKETLEEDVKDKEEQLYQLEQLRIEDGNKVQDLVNKHMTDISRLEA